MKNPISLYSFVVRIAFLSLFTIGNAAAQVEVLPVAILDFEASGELEGQGPDAASLLAGLLSAESNLYLVERAELDKILSEAELTLAGAVSTDSALEIGQLTGAKVLVMGRMFSAGATNYAVAKVISTETGRVFGCTAKFGKGQTFADGIEILAANVTEVLQKKSADLVAKNETADERLQRLKKLIVGKDLARVFVQVPETHLTRTIPDPAAETEIRKTLQDLGFVLADNQASADVLITGEAFSENAGRRANLISCRARVELLIRRKAKPDDILVERQTSVAIDLSENVAAKSALQDAGSKVAERLVTFLVK